MRLLLLVVLAGFVALLELRHPYYFLQDDNRTTYLGQILAHWRGLRDGELPLYNFHQLLGLPAFAFGPVVLFYPPAYAALLASQALWGHPYATIDLLVTLHLAAGLLGMERLLRHLGLSSAAVALGALSWPLSSMAVYVASSWWSVAGVIAYLPWTILLALRLLRQPTAGALATLAVVRAAFVYVGHVQFFVYAACFELLCALLAARAIYAGGWRRRVRPLTAYLSSLYLTAALALPFVQTQWFHTTQSRERAAPLGFSAFRAGSYNVLEWLEGTVNPFRPLAGGHEFLYPYLSFSGHATVLLLLGAPLLLRRAAPATALPPHVFTVPLAVAFLWTIGALDRIVYLAPVLNRFRWHFRINVVVVFFMVVVAAQALAAAGGVLRRRYGERTWRAVAAAALLVQLGGFLALYGTQPPRPINVRPSRERPPLREPLATSLAHGRIVALGFHSADPYTAAQLAFDYASLWGLFQYGGSATLPPAAHHDRFVGLVGKDERRLRHDGVFKPAEVPVGDFARWAVAWYLVAKNAEDPAETRRYRQQLAAHGMTVVAEDERRIVFADPHAQPLVALDDGRARQSLQPRIGGRSLAVRFRPDDRARQLVAAFLARPGLSAQTGDGRPLPLHRDPLDRLVVAVPPAVDGVRFVYDDPALRRGVRNGGLLLAASPLLFWWLRRSAAPGGLEPAPS